MLKKNVTKMISGLLLFAVALGIFGQNTMQADAITVSKTGYEIIVEAGNVFVGNKNSIGAELGTEYFMTYTVKSVGKGSIQQGLCGTATPTQEYPYDPNGFLRFSNQAGENESENLILPGATYYIKFTVAKGCFRYNLTRDVNGKLEHLYFEEYAGTAKENMQHFGIWLGETPDTQVKLTNVHCYDAQGNDLGVQLTEGHGKLVDTAKQEEIARLRKDTKVNHRYDIIIENQNCIAISHVKKPTSSKVYLEYKVESTDYKFNQEGIALSDSPLDIYPYTKGKLWFNNYYDQTTDKLLLLEKGAEYIICMEKNGDSFEVFVQKTINGETTIHRFNEFAQFDGNPSAAIFSLWIGDQPTGSFKLTNLKFYDENKNNLGVQCNRPATILHYGELESYEGCEATYYCEETGDTIALFKDQKLKGAKNESNYEGTYSIVENVMTIKIGSDTEKFDYYYAQITDKEGKVYHRLRHYTVNFVTGKGTKIEPQKLSNDFGYIVLKPSDPVLEGYAFEGWFLKDGTAFEFDKIQTKSVTLYAKYSGDGGIVYLSSEDDVDVPTGTLNYSLLIAGATLVVVAMAVCVACVKKGACNGKKKTA